MICSSIRCWASPATNRAPHVSHTSMRFDMSSSIRLRRPRSCRNQNQFITDETKLKPKHKMYLQCVDKTSIDRICSIMVQVMAFYLFRAKPLPEPRLTHCQLDLRNKFQWTLNHKKLSFFLKSKFKTDHPLNSQKPHGLAMGCLLWVFQRKFVVL